LTPYRADALTLTAGCQFPVANSQLKTSKTGNGLLAADNRKSLSA